MRAEGGTESAAGRTNAGGAAVDDLLDVRAEILQLRAGASRDPPGPGARHGSPSWRWRNGPAGFGS